MQFTATYFYNRHINTIRAIFYFNAISPKYNAYNLYNANVIYEFYRAQVYQKRLGDLVFYFYRNFYHVHTWICRACPRSQSNVWRINQSFTIPTTLYLKKGKNYEKKSDVSLIKWVRIYVCTYLLLPLFSCIYVLIEKRTAQFEPIRGLHIITLITENDHQRKQTYQKPSCTTKCTLLKNKILWLDSTKGKQGLHYQFLIFRCLQTTADFYRVNLKQINWNIKFIPVPNTWNI